MALIYGVGRYRAWCQLSAAERRSTAEAAVLILWAFAAVRILPFGVYSRWLGTPGPASHQNVAPPNPESVGHDVRRALCRAGRHLPWASTCLTSAVAGQVMLRRRQCNGTVYVGVEIREGRGHRLHAWLLAGTVPTTGVHESRRYSVVALFR